ncbi:hypothetical protein LSH36_463g04047 [Paralvinella palmiformis]|uniref:Uncharacterized protein n=1 Tax=Paralvinella palmiformis TaxID=53620 RepID=A0AAD9MZX6_9ANNE|nr:hypothetical protein LSH36_463g04047 [Paralvinella palmiformis]
MSTERCAELMAVGIANKLDEMWISDHPGLGLLYAAQYMPDTARLLVKKFGLKHVMKKRFNLDPKGGKLRVAN